MRNRKIVLAGLMLALGIILPFITGQIPRLGNMFLPMHIPVLLCGMLCGWQYGLMIGLILPFVRFVLVGMPVLYPTGIAMAFELGAYGAISGVLYAKLPKKMSSVYIALISAMAGGRIIWAVAQILLLGFAKKSFTWATFVAGAFTNAVPGIIIQLVFIPIIIGMVCRKGKWNEK